MRAATTHSSGTTLFTFTALKCAITAREREFLIRNHDDTHQSTRIGCLHERRSYSRVHTTPGSNVDTPIAGDTTRSRMASEVLSLGPERHL